MEGKNAIVHSNELDEKSEQEIINLVGVGGHAPTNMVVIKNVNPFWSMEQLFQLCSSFGEVVTCTRPWKANLGRYAPYAFVTFCSPKAATLAKLILDQCYIPDVPRSFPRMTVSYWENRPAKEPTNVYFGNLPPEYTLMHVYDLCRPYQPHNKGRLFRSEINSGALIRFFDSEKAAQAIRELNHIKVSKGRIINVRLADRQRPDYHTVNLINGIVFCTN